MPQLDHQWIIFEAFAELVKVSAFFAIVLERPGKLEQHRAQAPRFHQWIEAFAKSLLIFISGLAAFMRERSIEFGREAKVWIVLHATQPRPRGVRLTRMI